MMLFANTNCEKVIFRNKRRQSIFNRIEYGNKSRAEFAFWGQGAGRLAACEPEFRRCPQ